MSDIIVLAPHADDETFGMGGTISKLASAGDTVHVLLFSLTDVAFHHLDGEVIRREQRRQEFLNACAALDCRPVILSSAECRGGDLEQIPIRLLINSIEEVQDSVNAAAWYVCGPCYHQDHRRVFEAGMAAGRMARRNAPREIYSYELPTYPASPRQWQMHIAVYEDITSHVKQLSQAIASYESQQGSIYWKQTLEMARARGNECKCEYAEAFEVTRIVR